MSVVVPFSQAPAQRQQMPEAQPTYLAIAAAQMHADSRLFALGLAPAVTPTKDEPVG